MEGNMNLGDKVIIKECHSVPELVGKEAKVVVLIDPELTKYPLQVLLINDPVEVQTSLGKASSQGPFPFREDELEPFDPNHGIPDVFTRD
jgi:hypothetical protein